MTNPDRFSTNRRALIGGATAAVAAAGILRADQLALAAPVNSSAKLAAGFQEGDRVIIIGTLGEAATINGFLPNDTEAYWRCKLLFEQFVRTDGVSYEPTPGPGIVESWELDELSYTFKIHDNATFSDGTDLTADDASFTIHGILNPETASPNASKFSSVAGAEEYVAGSADSVSGIEVVDSKTIKITLATPDASFLYNLRYVFVVPKAQLEGKNLGTDDWFKNPVGAGPFKFDSWSVGGDFVASKNEHYYQEGKPAIDGLIHRVIADANTLALALQTGEIDGSVYPSPALRSQIEQNSDMTFTLPPFTYPDGWTFNHRNEWLAKPEVRQAIVHAIDVSQFAADSLLGLGEPAVGPIAPGNWAFDSTLSALPYDPDKSRELLASVNFPEDISFRASVNIGNVLREDWLVYSQQALAEVGITLDAQPQEFATLIEAVSVSRDFDMVGIPFSGVTADPGELYEQFSTNGSQNDSGYSNPDLDALLAQARQELDVDTAKGIYSEIQKILIEESVNHFAWYRPFLNVVHSKVQGLTPSNLEEGIFYSLEDASISAM